MRLLKDCAWKYSAGPPSNARPLPPSRRRARVGHQYHAAARKVHAQLGEQALDQLANRGPGAAASAPPIAARPYQSPASPSMVTARQRYGRSPGRSLRHQRKRQRAGTAQGVDDVLLGMAAALLCWWNAPSVSERWRRCRRAFPHGWKYLGASTPRNLRLVPARAMEKKGGQRLSACGRTAFSPAMDIR